MRIRKNAKNSAFLNTNPNSSRSDAAADADECELQKQNLCHLNQSPWDVITFPSSKSDSSSSFHLRQAYHNVNLSGNGNSIDSIGDFDQSVASKTSELGENKSFNGRKKDCGENLILGFKEEGESSDEKIQEEIKLCGKRDEKGWQCGNVVKYGNTMCDYHLSVSELQNDTVRTTKKKSGLGSGLMTTGTRRCEARKRPMTNPHDLYYYYYSGFGPSWGKKRGTVSNACNEVITTTDRHSGTGYGVRGIDDDLDLKKEKVKRFKPGISEVGPMESDYIDDDDEDYEDENGIVGKKRVRKPIKERSLKSLM